MLVNKVKCISPYNNMNSWKDVTQYATAVASFLSGVAMAFASFIRNNTVQGEILGFIGECFTLTGGIFGVGLYVRHKTEQMGMKIRHTILNDLKNAGNDIEVANKSQEDRL